MFVVNEGSLLIASLKKERPLLLLSGQRFEADDLASVPMRIYFSLVSDYMPGRIPALAFDLNRSLLEHGEKVCNSRFDDLIV